MKRRILVESFRAAASAATQSFREVPDGVWRRSGALNTWGTNAVEGNTLSHADVEELLLQDRTVGGHPVRDIVETLQHETAFRGLPQRATRKIDLVTVLELHEEVFRGSLRGRPGHWRTINVFIAGTKHRPPRADKLLPAMEGWLAEYRQRARRDHPLDAAAWMHHSFEAIHPFEDGNGRVGRLLLNLHLLSKEWPPVHVLPPDRARYLASLEAGNAGDLGPLTSYLEALSLRSALDLLDQVGGGQDELREMASFDGARWNPYRAHYLALRARQESLAAVPAYATSAPTAHWRRPGRPRWLTSERALRWYVDHVARSDAGSRRA